MFQVHCQKIEAYFGELLRLFPGYAVSAVRNNPVLSIRQPGNRITTKLGKSLITLSRDPKYGTCDFGQFRQ